MLRSRKKVETRKVGGRDGGMKTGRKQENVERGGKRGSEKERKGQAETKKERRQQRLEFLEVVQGGEQASCERG